MDSVKQAQEMGYDRSVGMFSPEGLLLQVEYAEKAVKLGAPVMALVSKEGIVFLADRKIKSKLLVKDSFRKITEVDSHVAITGSGVMSDGRRLIEQAQMNAQDHRVKYHGAVDILSLVKDIANIQQYYSQSGGLRPFGVNLLIGGIEEETPQLFLTTSSGMYFRYLARSVGTLSEKLNDELETEYKENLSANDAIKLGLSIFKKVLDEEYDYTRFDIAVLKTNDSLVRLSESEIKKLA
jgi:proteasome alpha subunit